MLKFNLLSKFLDDGIHKHHNNHRLTIVEAYGSKTIAENMHRKRNNTNNNKIQNQRQIWRALTISLFEFYKVELKQKRNEQTNQTGRSKLARGKIVAHLDRNSI